MHIQELVKAVLSELKQITKTETVIGEPIRSGSTVVVPVSKISIGFGIGGGQAGVKGSQAEGTGGGISIEPVAFVVIREENVSILAVAKETSGLAQLVDLVPEAIETIKKFKDRKTSKKPDAGKNRP